ncbi:MAG: hypothetical protein FCKEOINB_02172 [Nitrosomonas sp.]|nr:hypothetical protein [Nitrosomonas sp.]
MRHELPELVKHGEQREQRLVQHVKDRGGDRFKRSSKLVRQNVELA